MTTTTTERRYRRARVRGAATAVAQYLPENYVVAHDLGDEVIVFGHDRDGWTLDGYVTPRLASGLYPAVEVGTWWVPIDFYQKVREVGLPNAGHVVGSGASNYLVALTVHEAEHLRDVADSPDAYGVEVDPHWSRLAARLLDKQLGELVGG